ncbi:MAG: regulatory protein RecX [Acidobacteriota bacterium]|nr:regulatory protein RecX [Acidobacteriota bacterium]MDP2391456.1 regulatory protein RecX [Acidobacteriota bacterium]
MADAYLTALTMLSRRELSESQIRTRLARREFEDDEIEAAVERLRQDGTLNDRRVALAAARLESSVRHRGRARVIQKLRSLGIDGDVAESAVNEVFEEVDEGALLDRALERRLRGKTPKDLDDKGRARIVRGLAAQGFAFDAIMKRLRPPSR